MFSHIRWVAFGALLFLAACGDHGALIEGAEGGADEADVAALGDELELAQAGETGPAKSLNIGQARQAQIDSDSSGCFGSVPPFVQPQDFFNLTPLDSFRPRSLCEGDVFFFMVDNLVKGLGIPFIRPFEAPAANCADLQVFFAIGRYEGANERPTIVAEGSKRGRVVVRDGGTLFCDISLLLQPSDLNDMPDGEDYIFAVQALDDDGDEGVSEQVVVTTP